jgi:hypothetical protein
MFGMAWPVMPGVVPFCGARVTEGEVAGVGLEQAVVSKIAAMAARDMSFTP